MNLENQSPITLDPRAGIKKIILEGKVDNLTLTETILKEKIDENYLGVEVFLISGVKNWDPNSLLSFEEVLVQNLVNLFLTGPSVMLKNTSQEITVRNKHFKALKEFDFVQEFTDVLEKDKQKSLDWKLSRFYCVELCTDVDKNLDLIFSSIDAEISENPYVNFKHWSL